MTVWIMVAEALIGLAYTLLGVLTVYEMVRERRTLGRSQFGLAFAAMAFTCGPHHLIRAVMAAAAMRAAHAMPATEVAVSLLVGLPPGVVFVALRCESLRGGAGDRSIRGLPNLVTFCGAFGGVMAGAILARAAQQHFSWSHTNPVYFGANLVLGTAYVAVGCYILTTQVRRYAVRQSWSLSGVALGFVFPTCALLHLAHVFTGGHTDGAASALTWFDAAGIPASIWFLVVVRRLYQEGLADWNRRPLVGRGLSPRRLAPWESA